jgi:hypothetical protein
VRSKVVEYEGQKFTISPLKVRQVQELYQDPTGSNPITTPAEVSLRGAKVICASLNNAKPFQGDELEHADWTPERVLEEIDFPTFNWLHNQITAYMGWDTRLAEDDGKKKDGAEARP